jgi:hypothetical protein
MKKIFITAILFSSLAISVFAADGGKKRANTSNSDAVSYTVLNQFTYDFKDAKDVVWTVNGNCQKADFVLEGKKVAAFYSLSGEYLGITRDVTYKSVPLAAQKEINSQYASYTIGEVIELQPKPTDQSATDLLSTTSFSDDAKVYFVDLKNDKEEVLVRVTPNADVYFFKQVK